MTIAPTMNKNGEIEGGGLYYYTTPHKSKSKTPDESSEGYTSSLSRIYHSMVSYTSDAGWGCMMRSGQMMLGQAFVHYYLGRGFRLPPDDNQANMYQMILSWFLDREEAPYSIHRIAQAGTLFNKKVGEWFGPSTIAMVLQYVLTYFIFTFSKEISLRAFKNRVFSLFSRSRWDLYRRDRSYLYRCQRSHSD
jgi:hypothetical protein